MGNMNKALPEYFKVLSDDTRLKILLLLLRESELCVCELMVALDESQPKISRHLALLKKQAIVSDRKERQWVFYSLHPDLPNWFESVLVQTANANNDYTNVPLTALEAMGDRPKRQSSCC